MNTAIHEEHNLGWKLAWVVCGLADEALLDSYAAEQEPIGRRNAWLSLMPVQQPEADRYRTGDTGAVLVRPDGFVAWHCPAVPGDLATALADAVSGALGGRPDALTRAAG